MITVIVYFYAIKKPFFPQDIYLDQIFPHVFISTFYKVNELIF